MPLPGAPGYSSSRLAQPLHRRIIPAQPPHTDALQATYDECVRQSTMWAGALVLVGLRPRRRRAGTGRRGSELLRQVATIASG
jgi:hypothetical protein